MKKDPTIQDIISGKSKVGVELSIDKESAALLAVAIIGAILIGGLLLRMLVKAFNLN